MPDILDHFDDLGPEHQWFLVAGTYPQIGDHDQPIFIFPLTESNINTLLARIDLAKVMWKEHQIPGIVDMYPDTEWARYFHGGTIYPADAQGRNALQYLLNPEDEYYGLVPRERLRNLDLGRPYELNDEPDWVFAGSNNDVMCQAFFIKLHGYRHGALIHTEGIRAADLKKYLDIITT